MELEPHGVVVSCRFARTIVSRSPIISDILELVAPQPFASTTMRGSFLPGTAKSHLATSFLAPSNWQRLSYWSPKTFWITASTKSSRLRPRRRLPG